ncbi:hypothetical protein [Streptomyces sp. NPDC055186]
MAAGDQFAARRLERRRTRWSSTAEVRLRYATVDFAHAVFEYPLTIAAEADLFVLPDGRTVAEQALAHAPDATVRMASLRGADAAHLVLADVDLPGCLFTRTVHLDQVRLEGTCAFDEVPPRRRRRLAGFAQRRTLAEEHHWRAKQPEAVRGWNPAVLGAGHVGPAQLASVYRALRKAFEDGKNEPGAADFYYGEMEMRRHDRTGTIRAERRLLHGYWLLSGYGLRASRALGRLTAAMLLTIVLLMGFGLPEEDPTQEAAGTLPPGGGCRAPHNIQQVVVCDSAVRGEPAWTAYQANGIGAQRPTKAPSRRTTHSARAAARGTEAFRQLNAVAVIPDRILPEPRDHRPPDLAWQRTTRSTCSPSGKRDGVVGAEPNGGEPTGPTSRWSTCHGSLFVNGALVRRAPGRRTWGE